MKISDRSLLSVPPYTPITYPLLGSVQYFSHHWDFLRTATQDGIVSFRLANQKCIALPVESRQAFFNDSRPSLTLAYAVMLGTIPMNKHFLTMMGFDITLGGRSNKFLASLLRKERVNANLHTLYAYADECITGLSSTTDPFQSIYGTIFRLTVNTIAASRIAADAAVCDKLRKIFHELDQSATPATVLFPWFLGPQRLHRFYLMKRFSDIMGAAIKDRRKGRSEEDPMQYLIDAGLTSMEITQFTLGALFAGIANTGIVAAYILCDLATHPAYLDQVRAELSTFISSFNADSSLPLLTRLHSISYEDWIQAGALPILDRCLKETLRLRIATPLHRLNDSGGDMEIGGVRVPHDTILSFHMSFMHHNEEFYTDVMRWDPERFTEGREEDRSAPMAFCGWGGGKHQCPGKKFATFEIFLLTALMVSSYDIQAVDGDGQSIDEMPPADLNNTVIAPPTQAVHLKLSPRVRC
ncbi:cytochrome P450 [Mycena crocata]|nr:cytochrome P450 [Mycena crocata]